MKRTLYLVTAASFFLMLIPSCNPQVEPDDLKPGQLDNAPVLKADVSSVSISDYNDETCLTYSWNDVAPEGTSPVYAIISQKPPTRHSRKG